MPLSKFDGLELPPSADFHVHLRDSEMMKVYNHQEDFLFF